MIFLMSESKLLESVSSEPVTPMTLDVEPVFVEDFFRFYKLNVLLKLLRLFSIIFVRQFSTLIAPSFLFRCVHASL